MTDIEAMFNFNSLQNDFFMLKGVFKITKKSQNFVNIHQATSTPLILTKFLTEN